MRKLASIVEVDEILPIENADAIELARVGGWQCVVKRGEFSPGDLGVYFEIDSVPPDDERFRFLWDRKNMGIGRPQTYRVRTIKLRGALSQGLLMPPANFSELWEHRGELVLAHGIGDDVSEMIGVTKYDPPIPAGAGDIAGAWNFECPKTDEPRLQSNMHLLEEFGDRVWVATLKLDGSSMTVGIDMDGNFGISSRNWMAKRGDNMYWKLIERLGLEEKFQTLGDEFIFQGELVGPGIQKNPLGLKDLDFYVFNIWSRTLKRYLSYTESFPIPARYGLNAVRVVADGFGFHPDGQVALAQLLEYAKGFYPDTNNHREGIVVRPRDEHVYSHTLGTRLSFKVINNEFLLSEKD